MTHSAYKPMRWRSSAILTAHLFANLALPLTAAPRDNATELAQRLDPALHAAIEEEDHTAVAELWEKYVEATGDTTAEQLYKEDHPRLIIALDEIANSLIQVDKLVDAIPIAERALNIVLDIAKELNENDNNERASRILALAMLKHYCGDFNEALEYYNRALNYYKANFNDPETILLLSSLGSLYQETGDYDNADSIIREALEIGSNFFQHDNHLIGPILLIAAEIYHEKGSYSEAMEFAKRARNIILKSVEKESNVNDLIYIYNILGLINFSTGQNQESEKYYDSALELIHKYSISNNHLLSTIWSNLAVLYMKQGRFFDSELFFRKALN